MIALKLSNLSLSYDGGFLLQGINLKVISNQWVAILGRSGCGKSTLLKAIANIDHGAVQYGDIEYNVDIAYMAQQDSLLPWLNVIQNVELSCRLQNNTNPKNSAKAHNLLIKVGLDKYANKSPNLLSGGQRQRVSLARTLMQSAELVLMDEPFSSIDAISRLELQRFASELLVDKTVILITHDPLEAMRLADIIYVIRNGRLSKAYYPINHRPRFDVEQFQPELQRQLLAELR